MANVLSSQKIKNGELIPVSNELRKKFSNAKGKYFAVWVEDENDAEECLLFTEKEIERAKYRASRNPEDLPQKSWFTDLMD